MTNKIRKHMWAVSGVMAIAIVGALAAFIVLASNPGAAIAHAPVDENACDSLSGLALELHNVEHELGGSTPCPAPGGTTTETPAVPGFTIEHGGQGGQVTVNWDAVEGVAEYTVEYRQCDAVPCTGIFTVVNLAATTKSHSITGLNPGAQYQVQVTAKNATGMVLAQSSSLASTSRYQLTFNTGTTPLRSDLAKPCDGWRGR